MDKRTIFNIAASGSSCDLDTLETLLTEIKEDEGLAAAAVDYAGQKGLTIAIDADTSSYDSSKKKLHLAKGVDGSKIGKTMLASMIHSATRCL